MNRLRLILILCLLCALAACGAPSVSEAPTEPPTPVRPTWTPRPSPTPVLRPTPPQPRPTVRPTPKLTPSPADAVPLATLTAELSATVVASLPPTPTPKPGEGDFAMGIEGASALALQSPDRPLWAVHSRGMRGVDPPQNHFVAIYTREGESWKELDRAEIANDDYLDEGGVAQAQVDDKNIWLSVQGGAGAHSGCFDLLRFDGQKLHDEASNCSSGSNGGWLRDIDGDGTPEVVLDATDYYVFCYACGVARINYGVLRWDGEKMVEIKLAPLPDTAPAELRDLTNQAVALGQAGFWKDAQATISQTFALSTQDEGAAWDAGLIRNVAEARAAQAQSGAYPLLDNLFYGDYAAALDVMRQHTPADLFGAESPLVKGTTAEGWEPQLADAITETANMALQLKPDFAPALFLRGWALHLGDPHSPAALADIERAAQLDPQEKLFAESLAYLRKK